ncbi:hypothetical protein VTN02DRAFT_1899 [Thermoascus thermophilus]
MGFTLCRLPHENILLMPRTSRSVPACGPDAFHLRLASGSWGAFLYGMKPRRGGSATSVSCHVQMTVDWGVDPRRAVRAACRSTSDIKRWMIIKVLDTGRRLSVILYSLDMQCHWSNV